MSEEIKYAMGVDAGGYDGNTYSICVVKKVGDNVAVEYLKSKQDKYWYDKEVKRLSEYYRISEGQILKEK